MSWRIQLRNLPIRTKLAITVVGAGLAVLGLSTYLSFQYWRKETRAVAEQQALLAAVSTRASIEASLNRGSTAAAQRTLAELLRNSAVRSARVYAPDGRVIMSARVEEVGQPAGRIWIPRASELPPEGVARPSTDESHSVHAFAPIGSTSNVLEVEFSLQAIESAMQRGARLGVGLLVASLLALALILYAMLQREVVAPLRRVALMLNNDDPMAVEDPHVIETEIAELKQKGETAQLLADQRGALLEERAGFAEVGEVAAEMAHEFKRPLAAIRTAIQLLEQEYTLTEDGQKLLLGIDGQLERLSDTMRDVFGLAKPVSVERETVDLSDVLNDALLQLAANTHTSAITVRREYSHDLPKVQGDGRRLELAFLNLMNNAVDAMQGRGGGLLTIRATASDNAVDIAIADTGCGIDKADVQNVVKPFYSTKPTGTGLGLPLVARVVAGHCGQLRIESEKGEGTTVHVRLPLALPETIEPEEPTWAQQESSSSTTTISSAP